MSNIPNRDSFDASAEASFLDYERRQEYEAIMEAVMGNPFDDDLGEFPGGYMGGSVEQAGMTEGVTPIDPEAATVRPHQTDVGVTLTSEQAIYARSMLAVLTGFAVQQDRRRNASGYDDAADAAYELSRLLEGRA